MPVTRSFRLLGRSLSLTALACSWPFLPSAKGVEPPRPAQRVAYRVGFLGVPRHPHTRENRRSGRTAASADRAVPEGYGGEL